MTWPGTGSFGNKHLGDEPVDVCPKHGGGIGPQRRTHPRGHGGVPGPLAQRLYDAITRLQYGEDPDTRGWQTLV